ncbi:ubiquitin carboxyl-terminal hydrolase [Colletotrichum plurivorum]|uniref:Ubiquitin carboxyl-terminal hydrolase n=1 Tax=Colletotrichum plurivorum TaxID=2175906 RepID=A0A8H6KUF5_9PEZI|nr:ubiquitin carboxyl-terminal hydrolase [Colletotrichum plurivorum]
MDQPTVSSEAPVRAVSSEPSSTRPNPFTEGDDASRKRRRTSISGGSRSRSVESTRSGLDTSSSPAVDLLADDQNTQDSAMKIDTGPSTPQTPELHSTAREPPTEPPSSRVTINLRHAVQPDPSSSPISPTPQALPNRPTDSLDAVKKSVEDSDEVDMVQAPIEITDTPPSTSSSIQSTEVEVVAIPDDDEDAPFDDEVSIIPEDGASLDPILDFPYRETHESLPATVSKLINYFSSQTPPDENVILNLQTWMASYVRHVDYVGMRAAYESHVAYHDFWHMFPEIAWMLSSRKQLVTEFFNVFAALSSFLVEFDFMTAQLLQTSPEDERRQPDFLLGRYTQPLLFFARRDESRQPNGFSDEDMLWTRTDVTEVLNTFQSGPGSVKGLCKLAQMHAENASRYHNLMDVLLPIANVTSLILQKTVQAVRQMLTPARVQQAKARLADAHLIYNIIAEALSAAVQKNVTQLSNDTAAQLISQLSEILRLSLSGDHKLATERLKEHRQAHPELPLKFTAEAISLEWRLRVLGKLVTSSQMQLRVMAASTMCHELVTCWKKYSDSEDDNAKLLEYVAQYLLGTKLVDYILGPTCHPEITLESGNIVGFLVVTRLYREEQTDLLWQTITTTQDPRISEALIRMTHGIANLFHPEQLLYLCEKLQRLPIENFTAPVRNLCDAILRNLHNKSQLNGEAPSILPLSLCIRLLREASVYNSESHVAYPEVHQFAIIKFREIAKDGLDPEIRKELYVDCIRDIASKSSTTLGTLWCLAAALRPAVASELRTLTTEHHLTALLVDELEHAIERGKRAGSPMVLCGSINAPRREFISHILSHEAATVTTDLGPRLWDMLVGHGAACQEDRNAGWAILNGFTRLSHNNPFLAVCSSEYLPRLPRDCFCEGTLQFVRSVVLPRVNDLENGTILDDDESLAQSGVEQLWRMILGADNLALVDAAIQTLVGDVYIDSKSILACPHYRACQVHLGLVNRCLKQMEEASNRLDAFGDETRGGDDEAMEIVGTEEQSQEQEHIFTRSLAVLRHFLRAHRAKAQFSAPDLRALTPGSPSVAEGESAELKYQSFDGSKQTDIMPLEVGRRNTAASLLASIRQATGFDNYRIYYRGRPFAPNERDVCRSLEDLKIHDGLILVKREENGTATATRIKPGASLLEIEILGHFNQLWNYLSMREVLAKEIHAFLTKLPADAHMLSEFDSPDTSYQQIFPPGQPFKSLYAMHAMKEYMDGAARRLKDAVSGLSVSSDDERRAVEAYLDALVRVRKLVVAAISDPVIIDSCESEALKNRLVFCLMNIYMLTFRGECRSLLESTPANVVTEPEIAGVATKPKAVAMAPAERLVEILTSAVTTRSYDAFVSLISSAFTAILRSIAVDAAFWASFEALPNLEELFGTLLLYEPSGTVRGNIAKLIGERVISTEDSNLNIRSFRIFLWPILRGLIQRATQIPKQCHEVFELSRDLAERLAEESPNDVNIPGLAGLCGELLLEHSSTEQLGHLGTEDAVASGLANLLRSCLTDEVDLEGKLEQLFWKHLFPPPSRNSGPPQSCILSTRTRAVLNDAIFYLVCKNDTAFDDLLVDLGKLVPFTRQPDSQSPQGGTRAHSSHSNADPYLYDLQPQFDRMSAVRAQCGYTGLRNLSNTCYLNSLLTQLFMNTGFRRFMMSARIADQSSPVLLKETRKLFAFMQESYRKYIDPSYLVSSIKTYEETVIDVHNQMDVDEFYNLLFDRWEGQLSTVEERKALRSFYGGQLVQQVSSKECEHISERLEPFSAIQCDIKGKSTLQDSLQAYVDGEIMEGGVACLKDIPDNLIFHLKRFDFNLRTLMRSKINDYFSFPTKIDMRPYTIDHLGSPSDSGEEDIFELVGVLVHAGTAESGHYYSYIRERPTSASSEGWYEFNDDVVSPWDPADMEKSTFGGPDVPFDNGISYDKTYSAYMLFYQRSTVLKAEQEKLQSLALSTPLKVEVPHAVADFINNENTILLRRHCLYDPSHVQFVLDMFQHARKRAVIGYPDERGRTGQRAMHMLLGHFDQVVSRTKDLPDLERFREEIDLACRSSAKGALDFFEYFQEREEAFRQLLQRNPDGNVRYAAGSMFITALHAIKSSYPELWSVSSIELEMNDARIPETVTMQTKRIFDVLWDNFAANIRSWPEVFQTVLEFAQMGSLETLLLLSDDWLANVLKIVYFDINMDPPGVFNRMATNVARRVSNTRPIPYEMVIQLIHHFMRSMENVMDADTIVDAPEERLGTFSEDDIPKQCWTSDEVSILTHQWGDGAGSTFIKKLVELNQNHSHTHAIVQRVMGLSPDMELSVFYAIKTMITGQVVQHSVAPFLVVAVVFCETTTSSKLVTELFKHVVTQCRMLQNAEGGAFLSFFRQALDSIRGHDETGSVDMYSMFIDLVPAWGPYLLGYFDAEVRMETEEFLSMWLSRYVPVGNKMDDVEIGVNMAARKLACNCLVYIRENVLHRRGQLGKQATESLQNMISTCEVFFGVDVEIEGSQASSRAAFQELKRTVMEPLRRMPVEEIEDEGSDWENSCASSDAPESLADIGMHMTGDLADSDLQ